MKWQKVDLSRWLSLAYFKYCFEIAASVNISAALFTAKTPSAETGYHGQHYDLSLPALPTLQLST